MAIFRDIYDAYLDTERAFREMGVDIADATCGAPKCILTKAQKDLADSLNDLSEVDIDLRDLDIDSLLDKINDCFECISFDDGVRIKPPTGSPAVESFDYCPVDGQTLTLDDIRRFRIYEQANGMIEVYVIPKADLPYSFTIPNTQRKYTVFWDSTFNLLQVRYTNKDSSKNAPAGGYTIASVVAELETPVANTLGVSEVKACAVYNQTNGTMWTSAGGIGLTVDGNDMTYPTILNSELKEVLAGFQFKV